MHLKADKVSCVCALHLTADLPVANSGEHPFKNAKVPEKLVFTLITKSL